VKGIPVLALTAVLIVLCAGCNRTGLSTAFRKSAEQAYEQLRTAEAGDDPAALDRAEKAIAEAKAKKDTRADWQLVDVLDWYAILVHRRNRARTLAWRQMCAKEVELYFAGEQAGSTRIGNTDVTVARGSCQGAAFEMMAQDCRQWAGSPSECLPDPGQLGSEQNSSGR
jgi:hypothetical protein